MKSFLLSSAAMAVLIVASIGLSARQAAAQGQPGMQGPGPIALVDVNYIFKHHVRLKSQREELQNEAKKVQEGFEQQMRQLNEEVKGLELLKTGTPEYSRAEEALVSKKAQLQGSMALKRKEFMQKEAHLFYNAYVEISDETKYCAQSLGIALVINFDGDKISEDSPQNVTRGITNNVVYVNKNLDITPVVMKRFLAGSADQRGGPGPQPPRTGLQP